MEPSGARGAIAVEMTAIRRVFGSVTALGGVDGTFRRGEIHAVLGANGAGKTTLMRILAGLDRPDEGEVRVDGAFVSTFDPGLARDLGIALVQQHFTLVPTLTAGENLVLAKPQGRLRPDRRAVRERLAGLVDRFGLDVRGDVVAGELSVGEQQRLELLRALDADADVLVLDEPTAVLTDAEADQLLGVCRALADDGRAVVIITHRLGEVFSGCDRVSVLRAGEAVMTDVPVVDCTRASLATAMIGSDATGTFSDRDRTSTEVPTGAPARARLRVTGLSLGQLDGIDLSVAAGEILGIAGVDGNGQSDLEAVLCGRIAPTGGGVEIDGVPLDVGNPGSSASAGVAYIPSDRYRHGLVRAMDLSENLELGRTRRIRRPRRQRHLAASGRLDDWNVRSAGPAARAASLSGGNAQKLVLARELDDGPGVVIACYPTRGLDPSAASSVADRLIDRAASGAAVLWIGAELDELFAVSDRLVVLSRGRIAGEFAPPFDRHAVGLAMTDGPVGSAPAAGVSG